MPPPPAAPAAAHCGRLRHFYGDMHTGQNINYHVLCTLAVYLGVKLFSHPRIPVFKTTYIDHSPRAHGHWAVGMANNRRNRLFIARCRGHSLFIPCRAERFLQLTGILPRFKGLLCSFPSLTFLAPPPLIPKLEDVTLRSSRHSFRVDPWPADAAGH